jgi:PKD repeat protein
MKKEFLILGLCIGLISTIFFVPNASADSNATLYIKIHRIQKLDEIEDSDSDEADWYYYIGISEDGGLSYDWTSPDNIAMKENDDDWKVNTNHIFSDITSTSVTIAIMLCEEDGLPGSDDLADISSGAYGGSNFYWDDLDDPIVPEDLPVILKERIFKANIYKGNYNLITDELGGDATTVELGYYKTSGEYDSTSVDENDAALYFDIWDNFNSPTSVLCIDDSYVKAGEIVNFDGSQSTAPTGFEIDRYQWDFNNDGVWDAEEKTTNFTYNDAGTYTVKLKITDSLDQTDTETGYVVVYPNINASFVYTPSNPSTLDTIQFTDTSKIIGGRLILWFWSFGDYSTSTLQNPTHKYSRGGTYTVKLKVTANDWQTTDYEIKYITVIVFASIIGKVEDSDGNPISDATIKLYDEDTVLKTISTDVNGEYTMSEIEIGTYDIEGLKNDYENNKKTGKYLGVGENSINFVLLPENQPPYADFSYSPKKSTVGNIISFTDLSSDNDGTIESYSWSFGDGTTSNQQNPKHKYSSAGKYIVNFTITDDRGKNASYNSVINIGESTPGFEFIFVLLSIAIVYIITSKKKLRQK